MKIDARSCILILGYISLTGCSTFLKKQTKLESETVLDPGVREVIDLDSVKNYSQVAISDPHIGVITSQVPEILKTVTRRQVKTPAKTIEKVVPANTKQISRQVVTSPASVEYRTVPPITRMETRRVLKSPERTETIEGPDGVKIVTVPAVYEMISERVVVQSGTTEIVTIPPTYKTVTETVVVMPERTEVIVIEPAQYETITENIVIQEASADYTLIPDTPEYGSVQPDLISDTFTPSEFFKPWFYDFYEVEESGDEDTKKVIGAKIASIGKFPWHVAIGRENDGAYKCGGTILDSKTIVTAAHCFFKMKPTRQFYDEDNIIIGVDGSNLEENRVVRAGMIAFEVKDVIPHDKYKHTTEENSRIPLPDYDIAIVKLKDPIIFSENVKPATLPRSDLELEVDQTLNLYGFGRYSTDSNAPSPYLQWGEVPFKTNKICNAYQMYRKELPATHFCAGVAERGAEACKGDSGGGLTLDNSSVLVGITSFGDPQCRLDGKPTAYTDIRNFLGWIKEHLELVPVVRYYKKKSDPESITDFLQKMNTQLDVRSTRRLSNEPSNAIWLGSKIDFYQARSMIGNLLESGAEIKRIAPFCSGKKNNIIEIGTSPNAIGDEIPLIDQDFINRAKSLDDLYTINCR